MRRKIPDCRRAPRQTEIRSEVSCSYARGICSCPASTRESKCRRAPPPRAPARCPSKGCDRACRRPARSRRPPAAARGDAAFPSARPICWAERYRRRRPCPDTGRECCKRTGAQPSARRKRPAIPATGGSVMARTTSGADAQSRAEPPAPDTKDSSKRGASFGGADKPWNPRARPSRCCASPGEAAR